MSAFLRAVVVVVFVVVITHRLRVVFWLRERERELNFGLLPPASTGLSLYTLILNGAKSPGK